jgi:hypothetical protein
MTGLSFHSGGDSQIIPNMAHILPSQRHSLIQLRQFTQIG